MGNQWLKETLGKGVAMLVLLRLRNAPPQDAIKMTLEAWLKVITHKTKWDENLDRWRLEEGFLWWSKEREYFPTPKEFLEIIPPRKWVELPPPPPLSSEALQKNAERLKQLKEWLNGKRERPKFNGENTHC